MNPCYVVQSSRRARLFSFGLLDGLSVRFRRPYMREAPAGFGLERLAMAFMNNLGSASPGHARCGTLSAGRRSVTAVTFGFCRTT